MKKVIFGFTLVGILLGTQLTSLQNAGQGGGFNFRDPNSEFDTKNNLVNKSTITWLTVDNLQQACEKESRNRGNGGFGYTLEACSFWTANSCTIITSKKTTIHALGHETLHCFQGGFH
jgi:hypothetical protein